MWCWAQTILLSAARTPLPRLRAILEATVAAQVLPTFTVTADASRARPTSGLRARNAVGTYGGSTLGRNARYVPIVDDRPQVASSVTFLLMAVAGRLSVGRARAQRLVPRLARAGSITRISLAAGAFGLPARRPRVGVFEYTLAPTARKPITRWNLANALPIDGARRVRTLARLG